MNYIRVLWMATLLLTANAHAMPVAFCDPNDPDVPNRVVRFGTSINEQPLLDNNVPNIIVSPDMSALTETNRRYWKCSGSALIDMTTAEKTALDADRVAAAARKVTDLTEFKTRRGQLRIASQNWGSLSDAQKDVVTERMLRFLLLRDSLSLE